MGNGVCAPTPQASDSLRAAIAAMPPAPPAGATMVPVTAGAGAGLAGLRPALAGPAVPQPAPRTAAIAMTPAASPIPARMEYLDVTILNQQPLPNALLAVTPGAASRFTTRQAERSATLVRHPIARELGVPAVAWCDDHRSHSACIT